MVKYGLLYKLMEEEKTVQNASASHSSKTTQEDHGVMHSFSGVSQSLPTKSTAIVFLVVIILGIGTGFVLSNKGASQTNQKNSTDTSVSTQTAEGKIFGTPDEKTFKDQATGVLKSGGIEGEGAYHLERPGGVSQNVYLTSSILDLSKFVDKKVTVWGETNSAKKAGWLMDVGRVQVLDQ